MGLSGVGMWGDIGVKKWSEERCSLCLTVGVKLEALRRGWVGYVVVEIGFGETITASVHQSSSNLAPSPET
jgi:hypothetical protein